MTIRAKGRNVDFRILQTTIWCQGRIHPAAEESWNVKYLCLVYEEEAKVDALPEHESAAIADENLDYLGELQMSGHCLASARLQPAEIGRDDPRPQRLGVHLRWRPSRATERLGGFHLIDARDLNDAIRIAAKMPRARLGWIEVRPLEECDSGLIASRNPAWPELPPTGPHPLPLCDYDGEGSGLQT